jgi:UDP-N-acetylmuramate dehydrogenase
VSGREQLKGVERLAATLSALGLEARPDEALSRHTSFGIGGPAALFTVAGSTAGLSAALGAAATAGVETLLLGSGTNLLVSDDGFPGLALRLDLGGITIDRDAGRIVAGAGVPAAELVERCVAAGLAGLEFAAGLPGTVGGAIAGNAGCFGSCFGDRLVRATIVTRDGEIVAIDDPCRFAFDYRCSSVSADGFAVAEAVFDLAPGDPEELAAVARAHLATRAERHPPPGLRTAGSYFKNLPADVPGGRRRAAGELLDQVGAKGMSVGDAAVFEKHANILINRGQATARDVLELARRLQELVRDRFGVELEPEVRFVGPRPEGY